MSIKDSLNVRDSGILKGAVYNVALALAFRADENGVAWPGVERLAADTRLSARSVRAATQTLHKRGLLTVDRGSRKTNSYQLNSKAFEEAARSSLHIGSDQPPLCVRAARRQLAFNRQQNPTERQSTSAQGEATAYKPKEIKDKVQWRSRDGMTLIEFFGLLDLHWSWKAETNFTLATRTLIGPSVVERWFNFGLPSFVIFADPLMSHGQQGEGLALSWALDEPEDSEIERVLRHFNFDPRPIWPWERFEARLCQTDLPELRPARADRLKWIADG
jgi:hypothetical protein